MRGLRHLIYLSLILIVTQARAQVVDIPDPNLERAIRETLALTDGTPITRQELLNLMRLRVESSDLRTCLKSHLIRFRIK